MLKTTSVSILITAKKKLQTLAKKAGVTQTALISDLVTAEFERTKTKRKTRAKNS